MGTQYTGTITNVDVSTKPYRRYLTVLLEHMNTEIVIEVPVDVATDCTSKGVIFVENRFRFFMHDGNMTEWCDLQANPPVWVWVKVNG